MRAGFGVHECLLAVAATTLMTCMAMLPIGPGIADNTDSSSSAPEESEDVDPMEMTGSTLGYWRTDRGPMTLFVVYPEGYGHAGYDQFNGFLLGNVDKDGDFIGYWHQDNGEILCDTSGGGLPEFRGRVIFWPRGEDRFVGEVMFCDDPPEGRGMRWDGVLIAGQAWFNPKVWIGPEVTRPELDMDEDTASVLMQRTFGDDFDPAVAQSHAFDMTCDGGRDYVYVWDGPADDPGFRLSVAHNEQPIYDTEDTASVETIKLGGHGLEQPGRCPIEKADEMAVEEIDPLLRDFGARTLAPTCTRIVVGPSSLCRIYWDLEKGTFGFY